MRFLTFAVPTPLGEITRLGCLTDGGAVVDLNLAYRGSLGDRMASDNAAVVADAVVPTDLVTLLGNGSLGADAVAAALEWLPARDVGTCDDAGAVLVHALADVRPLPPLRPTSLRDCSAYEDHVRAASRGNVPKRWYDFPSYYKGNPGSVVGDRADVLVPAGATTCDYELEYAVVIGREGRDLTPQQALDHVAGYVVFNDVSVREMQFREMSVGLGPSKSKDLDASNVLGPALVTPDEWDPHDDVTMRALVNGEEWSSGLTSTIHFPVEEILSHISRNETLRVGDVVGTGTVGGGCGLELGRYPQVGDTVELDIEGLGRLTNLWRASC